METVFEEKKAPGLEEVTASPTGDQSGSVVGAVEAMTGLGLAGRPPDPEVVERPARRRFSAEYKLRILREADGCTKTGEIGALMRREGLYSSHLTEWRRARELGYGVDREEYELGLTCIAMPLRLPGSDFAGAVSVSGPSARMRIPGAKERFLSLLKAATEEALQALRPGDSDQKTTASAGVPASV